MKKNYKLIFYIVTFMFWGALYSHVSILSGYAESLKASAQMIGIIIGSYGLMQFIFRLPLGILSDRIHLAYHYKNKDALIKGDFEFVAEKYEKFDKRNIKEYTNTKAPLKKVVDKGDYKLDFWENYNVTVPSFMHDSTIYVGYLKKQKIKKKKIKKDKSKKTNYPFLITDSPTGMYTMRQFNQNFLSSYRYLSSSLNNITSKNLSFLIQLGVGYLFLQPLTHEEGHRSILTSKGIGSISQPFFNTKGAYVKGVKDIDLKELRNNDLPTYVRLHTAGLESDYMLTRRAEDIIVFEFDNKQNLVVEYLLRKITLLTYYSTSMLSSLSPNIEEESNELDRDIVGHDVYGATRNLYQLDTSFYRYTDYEDLSSQEKKFINRIGSRSFINILTPVFFKPLRIFKKNDIQLSLGAGYSMSPFGDFIDENVWIKYKNKYNIHTYFRQFQNKNTWFLGGGIGVFDYKLNSKFKVSITTHFWNQPKDLNFSTTKSTFGAAANLLMKYAILSKRKSTSVSFDLGMIYKTFGFLPEEVILDEHFGVRVGVTVNLN